MTTTVPTANKSGTPPTAKRAMIIGGALLAVAVAIALIVSLASGDSETPESVSAGEAAHIPTGSLRQVSSVEVSTNLPRLTEGAVDAAVGMTAPTITGSYFDNAEVTIDPADGQPRVFLFLAHWCPHCQAEVQSLVPWFNTNGIPTDVEVVAVSTSVEEGSPNYPPSTWFLREGWPVPVVRDSAQGDIAAGFGLSGFPFMVVVNGDGEVLNRTTGGMTTVQWEAALALAAGS